METHTLQSALADYFAPWVRALGLRVTACEGSTVTLILPRHVDLEREGGMLSGQAMMAAADTAMVLALVAHFGAFRPCATVQMNCSFLKPLSAQDCIVQARVIRAGKALAFGEIDLRGAADGKSVCRATTTYALM